MGNTLSERYRLIKPDFEEDPIWKEHYPLIHYPAKIDWLKRIKADSDITEEQFQKIMIVQCHLVSYYKNWFYDEEVYFKSSVSAKVLTPKGEQMLDSDHIHFGHLLTFLRNKCYRPILSIPSHLGDYYISLRDEPHIEVKVRDVCHMIFDAHVADEASVSFERHLEEQKLHEMS